MPYKSLAQEGWAHSPAGKKALGEAGVKEWDAATKGKKLPEKVKPRTRNAGARKRV
jgi:hypothetical protein